MTFESSFLANFTIESRLKSQWQQALAEADIQKRLIRFRQVLQQLRMSSSKCAHLWPSFLDTFLDDNHVRYLTEIDLQVIENVGVALSTVTDIDTGLPEAIWKRVLRAFIVRGDTYHAHSLLIRMYKSSSVRWESKEQIVHKLVQVEARYEEALKIYVDYLYHTATSSQINEVLCVLERVCLVSFQSNSSELRLANEVASSLIESQNHIKGAWKALAFYALLIEKKHVDAIHWFIRAIGEDPQDSNAIYGLLIAAIQSGEYIYVSKVTSLAGHLTNEFVNALLKIGAVLQWLDNRYAPGPPPCTAQEIASLKKLNLQEYIGAIFTVALGKLYLLEGNARRASEILRPVVSRHPEQLQWHYYSAWADAMLNDHDHLAYSFNALSTWPERWTIAVHLLDTHPTNVEQDYIRVSLEESAKNKQHLASIIKARIVLAQGNTPEEVSWVVRKDASLEENMEALRTTIGYAIYVQDAALLGRLIGLPLFQHLPHPDQELWRGLHFLIQGEIERGRLYLESVVNRYGYARAALVLGVHYVEHGMLAKAKYFLEHASLVYSDTKTALLYAYISCKEGRIEHPIEILKYATRQDDARVQYALGNLYLQQKQYRDANEAFNRLLRQDKTFLPNDWNAVIQCAKFVAAPSSIDLGYEVQQLEKQHKQTWLIWNAALSRIWFSIYAETVDVGEYIVSMLEHIGAMKNVIALEIVKAIADQCTRIEYKEQANDLIQILEQIKQSIDYTRVKHICQLGITIAIQRHYMRTISTYRLYMRYSIAERLKIDTTNGSLALLLVSIYLSDNEADAAVAVLRKVRPIDEWEQKLCLLLADILEGHPITDDEMLLGHIQGRAEAAIGYNLLNVLVAFLTGHSNEGVNITLAAFEKDQQTTGNILKMEQLFPYICAVALQKNMDFPQEIYSIAQASIKTKAMLTLVRYMTATDKLEEAYRLWKHALVEHLKPGDNLSQEFAQLLCHIGTRNYINKNSFLTKKNLQEAVYWFGEIEQGKLCDKVVEYLELRVAVTNLLKSMFPGIGKLGVIHERYAWLCDVIKLEPRLRKALLDDSPKGVRLLWRRVVSTEYRFHIWFLHLLAVLYKDYVFKRGKHASEEDWIRYTALWTLLLCSDDFWEYFSKERSTHEQGQREDLDEIQRESLFYDVLDEIFSVHSTRASSAFVEGNYNEAKIHLYCLDICRRGDEALIVSLVDEQKLTYAFPIDRRRMDWVKQQANKVLKMYTDALVKEAEKSVKDVTIIKNLSVSKNYEGGMHILEPFIAMDIPVLRVLSTCLQWYNDWISDLLKIQEYWHSQTLLVNADAIAKKLMPLCVRGEGYRKENQMLSEYFVWQGRLVYPQNTAQCIGYYKEALAWNPANGRAQELLKDLEKEAEDTEDNTEDWFGEYEGDQYEDEENNGSVY